MESVLYRTQMERWKSGTGPYPYSVSWPRLHRFSSVLIGSLYAAGIVGQATIGLTRFSVVDSNRYLESLHENPVIFVCWHRWASIAIEFAWWLRVRGGLQGRQVWLNLLHPRMGPTHVLCDEWLGVEMAFTGDSAMSRLSSDGIADSLRSKHVSATVVMPDGPDGPHRKFHRGALHMALRSGVPIVPLRITGKGHYCTKTWDEKRIPVPGSSVSIELGEYVCVNDKEGFSESQNRIISQMN